MLNLGLNAVRQPVIRVSNEMLLAAEVQYRTARQNLNDAVTALNNMSEVGRLSRRYPSYECQQLIGEMVGVEGFGKWVGGMWEKTKYYAVRAWHALLEFIRKWWTKAKLFVGRMFSTKLDETVILTTYSPDQLNDALNYVIQLMDLTDRAIANPKIEASAITDRGKKLKKAIKDMRMRPVRFTHKNELTVYRTMIDRVRRLYERGQELDKSFKVEENYYNQMPRDTTVGRKKNATVELGPAVTKLKIGTIFKSYDKDTRSEVNDNNKVAKLINGLIELINTTLTKVQNSITAVLAHIADTAHTEFKDEQKELKWDDRRGHGFNGGNALSGIRSRSRHNLFEEAVAAMDKDKYYALKEYELKNDRLK